MDRVFVDGKSFKRNRKLMNRLTTMDDSPWHAMFATAIVPEVVVAELKQHNVKTTAQLKKLADTQCKKAMKNEAKFGESGMPREVNVVMYAYMFCEVHQQFGRWLEEYCSQVQEAEEEAEGEDEDEADLGLAEGLFAVWEQEQFGFEEESMRAAVELALRGDAKQLVELTTELGVLVI